MARLPKRHWSYPLIALLASAVMIVRVVMTTHVFSNTVDEPYHIGSAVVLWESKQLTIGVQHPPLARWVLGWSLMLEGATLPEARDSIVAAEFPGFGIGKGLLFSGKPSYWRMLTAARHALLIFSVLALFYVYRLGRYLASPLVGMLATVFFSLDPTFLAHSGFIGTDVAGCAGFVAGLYYGLRWIAKPQAGRTAVAGVALGLAISCKLSCLLLVPVLLLILLLRRIVSRRRVPKLRWFALLSGLTFFVLWATYGFATNPMRLQAMFEGQPQWTRLPAIVQEQPIPMPSFFLGLIFLSTRDAAGHATYLNGQVSFEGWRMYFPEALAVKEPVGFLLALLAGLAIFALRWKARRSNVLLIPIVLVFAVAIRSHYQLGIRHLLPILPLMYLFAVIQLVRWRRLLPLFALILLTAVETAIVHPDYLAFFNFASGGPARGDRYLIDSNLDWGQDMARLATWLKSDESKGRSYSIRCSYASEPLLKELGLDPAALSGKPHGLFAISKNVQHGLEATHREQGATVTGEDYSWLSRYPVVKRIGYSIDVYDLDAKELSPR